MSIQYKSTDVSVIKYNNTNLTKVIFNGKCMWAKPYTLTVTRDSPEGIPTVSVRRTSTSEPSASAVSLGSITGSAATINAQMSTTATVYHDDVIQITATAGANYNVSGTGTYTITSNKTINLTSTYSPPTPTLKAPVITTTGIGGGSSMRTSATITNNNSVAVTCHYTWSASTGTSSSTVSISANSSVSLMKSNPYTKATIKAYFTASGYKNSDETTA